MTTQINLTPSGPRFSRLVPGLMRLNQWGLSAAELVDWIEACLDLRLTTFDHADIYGGYSCEARFGEALALKPGLRGRMQLVTKCGIRLVSPNRPDHKIASYDTSAAHIAASVENSLKNLHTDHIDLLLIHRPDALMDADEVAGAFVRLREAGKVLHFGVSNFLPYHFDLLQSRLDFPLVTNQVEFSVVMLDAAHDGTLDHCQQLRMAPMAWSPLAGGAIFRPETPDDVQLQHMLREIGERHGGRTVDQVALAWVMKHPSKPLPVLGTGKLERLQAAVDAEEIDLSREEWYEIWRVSVGNDVP